MAYYKLKFRPVLDTKESPFEYKSNPERLKSKAVGKESGWIYYLNCPDFFLLQFNYPVDYLKGISKDEYDLIPSVEI